jgi:hypothetical protein
MNRKLLLNLINGMLLVSFCNTGKAVGAVSPFLMEPAQRTGLPPSSPQELPEPEGIQVICNTRVLEVYESRERATGLWKSMLDLQKRTLRSNNWKGSVGIRNLVYHLAQKYVENDNQDAKDAIALYFLSVSECYAGELAGGDDDDTEQKTIDFVKECLVNEEKEPLFSL